MHQTIWRAFPVNIQTTLIYDTFITFLCHTFYFLSVYFLFCFLIFHFASIFFISLPINLYIRVKLISFIFYSLHFICVLYSSYLFHFFFSFRVRFFIFFLISMQHVITQRRRSFAFRHFGFRSHGGRALYCLSCGRGCLRDFK